MMRIITGCGRRDLCRDLFKNLPLQWQYILLLILFVVNNKNVAVTNLHHIYHYIKKESVQVK
jgi:hypothetical protein